MGTATINYPHVAKTPGICGGKARIEGTRVPVQSVVLLHNEGASDDRIRELYPDLTPAQIHAALAYYYDNREEVDAQFEEDDRFFAEAEQNWVELVARNGGQPPSDPTPEERAIPRPFPWTPQK